MVVSLDLYTEPPSSTCLKQLSLVHYPIHASYSQLLTFLSLPNLGMHAIKEKPVVVNGQIVIRPIMVVALTYDHRLLDGREAVTFLGMFLILSPLALFFFCFDTSISSFLSPIAFSTFR